MTNLDYFTFSAKHPEPLPDPFYKDGREMVIPPTADESNPLTNRNARLLELVSAFHVLDAAKSGDVNPHVDEILDEIRDILDKTPNINFSAFTQFFLVYNISHDTYLALDPKAKTAFLKDILRRYCAIGGRVFFLPDKGDKKLFASFRERFSVVLSSAATEQGKLPDMVLGINSEWFIVEMKNINGLGGGQDKQMTEVINFVRFSERDINVHYLVFLDGEYSNRLFSRGDYINESSVRKNPPKNPATIQ